MAARHIKWWVLRPLVAGPLVMFSEPRSDALTTRMLRHRAEVPEAGRQLFTGTLATKNRLWREYRSYLRQAFEYHRSADLVPGSSASLLRYYGYLNLAKAELLTTSPAAIVGQRIGHGLSYQPTASRTIAGDFLTVQNGVFPLLFAKRTGVTLAPGTKLPIARLLRHVPEIGFEVGEAGFGAPAVTGLIYAVCWNDAEVFDVVGVYGDSAVRSCGASFRQFNAWYEAIPSPDAWRDHFAITRRALGAGFTFYQSRVATPVAPTATGGIGQAAIQGQVIATAQALADLLEPAPDEQFEGGLNTSLYKSRMFRMPIAMARYLLMYYASSLVRYKPSQLDPMFNGRQAWLMDSFVDQSAGPLLLDSLSGIEQRTYLHHSPSAMRN